MSEVLLKKIAGMFRPCGHDFLKYKKVEVIMGPNDRAAWGYDTYFPIEWLVEDYAFTEDEAKEFVRIVHENGKEKEGGRNADEFGKR